MTSQLNLYKFNEIYDKTHLDLLKYVIIKCHTVSLFETNDKDIALIDTIEDNININDIIVKEDNWNTIWKYIKCKKNQDIPKVFYLYYKLELSIKEISNQLKSSESYIKHLIYRTLKELQDNFGNGGKWND